MIIRKTSAIMLAVMSSVGGATMAVEPPPLIPRHVLFGNPEKSSLRISPDGARISYLAPVNGVLNVWVGPRDHPTQAKPVTDDKKRGIRAHFWARTGKHILYIQDKGGDENWHIYSVNLDNDKIIDLTPFDGVQARMQQASYEYPNEILVAVNQRNPQLHDVYRVNITTAERKLVMQNNEGYIGYITDDALKVRLALKMTPDGGSEIFRLTGPGSWSSFATIPPEDALTTSPVELDKAGKNLYMLDSRGRNTAALTLVNIDSMQQTLLAEDPRADISGIVTHPTEHHAQAVQSTYKRRHWKVLDDAIQRDFEFLPTVADGDFFITSRTRDDKFWTVAYTMDAGPVRYYLYDRARKRAKYLFSNHSELDGLALSPMKPVIIKSRDELSLVSYLTVPYWLDPDKDGRPSKPLPMVLFVHGGPWARDNWGYNPYHQWLSNRGYAVLSVNYRGSTGFGKKIVNAATLEWARKMHDDLIDAVNWAVKLGIADKDKVAIMGGSYGGYATLVGLTFTPDTFACGVDIVGPSNLVTLIESIPPYWKPMLDLFTQRVGDPRTEDGRKMLLERSPLTFVDRIRKPLIIGQGANDPRVKQAEADQIVSAMKKRDIPVTYVLFPDEGHGFARPENRMAFNAVAEVFLAKNLGGRHEPVREDLTGSSIQVPEGADHIPELPKALKAIKKTAPGDT